MAVYISGGQLSKQTNKPVHEYMTVVWQSVCVSEKERTKETETDRSMVSFFWQW